MDSTSQATPSPQTSVPKSLPLNFQAAKLRIFVMFPYLDVAINSMSFIECKDVPEIKGTMAVDKHWRCYYDIDAVSKWPAPEVATVLIHEVWHLLRSHCFRVPNLLPAEAEKIFSKLPAELRNSHNYDKTRRLMWNYATDAEINDDLVHPDLPFPFPPIFPANLKAPVNEVAEDYYNYCKLPEDFAEQMAKMLAEGKIPGLPGVSAGSGSDGQERSYEVADGQDQRKIGEAETKNIGNITAQKILEQSKNKGDTPAGLLRWAQDRLDPIINWKSELRATLSNQAVRLSGLLDYTYSKANRRGCLYMPMIMAGKCAYAPSVCIAVDTSGSMSDTQIAQGLTEVKAALKCLEGADISFVSCDTQATITKKVFGLKDLAVVGGGGTDMSEAMRAMAKMRPDVAVLITDGYTDYPAKSPFTQKTKLITLLVADGAAPSFGKIIHATPRRKSGSK